MLNMLANKDSRKRKKIKSKKNMDEMGSLQREQVNGKQRNVLIEKARTDKVEYVSKGILNKVRETDGKIV